MAVRQTNKSRNKKVDEKTDKWPLDRQTSPETRKLMRKLINGR